MKPQPRSDKTLVGTLGVLLAAVGLVIPAISPAADDNQFAEYQLKAAYLYNFISYTEWPSPAPEELLVCVYGRDPFGVHLDGLNAKTAGASTLAVARLSTADRVDPCHVVFVSREAISNLDRLQEAIGERPVLLMADSPGAAAKVTINMVDDNDRVQFEINLREAQQHGLTLSYQLLRLAREVLQ